MTSKNIFANHLFKTASIKKSLASMPLIKVEFVVEISFETFGQIRYKDEDGRPWIKEFTGSKWSKEFFLQELNENSFSVFINNQQLLKGQTVRLIKKVDNQINTEIEFNLTGEKLFEGWFKFACA